MSFGLTLMELKRQGHMLKRDQKKIIINLEKECLLARQLLHDGKKEKAKLLLRKKKYAEQMLSKTDGQLTNLTQMVHDLSFACIEIQVVEGLKISNELLYKLREVLAVEDVERLMDETQEAIEKQQEIAALLSGTLTSEDEDAVLEELNAIAESIRSPVQEEFEPEEERVPEDKLENVILPEVATDEPAKGQKKVPKEERKQMAAAT